MEHDKATTDTSNMTDTLDKRFVTDIDLAEIPKITVELIDALTVDFYATYDMSIDSVTDILNAPATTLLDDGVAYTLGVTILSGSRITVTVDLAAVIVLNTTRI